MSRTAFSQESASPRPHRGARGVRSGGEWGSGVKVGQIPTARAATPEVDATFGGMDTKKRHLSVTDGAIWVLEWAVHPLTG